MTDYSSFQMIVDLPSVTPGLGFDETARALADLMMQSEPQFAVAVYGPWGSGKTTLMRAIKRELDAQSGEAIRSSSTELQEYRRLYRELKREVGAALTGDGSEFKPRWGNGVSTYARMSEPLMGRLSGNQSALARLEQVRDWMESPDQTGAAPTGLALFAAKSQSTMPPEEWEPIAERAREEAAAHLGTVRDLIRQIQRFEAT